MASEKQDAVAGEFTLEEIATEVGALRDLFQRRLLEDRAKSRLYDELYTQVGFVREELARTYLKPLYGELLLIIDRLRARLGDEVAESVVIELEEILGRRDVRKISASGHFDPAVHDAVRTETSDDVARGRILSVLRDGYSLGREVLRPAAVIVSSGPSTQPFDQPINPDDSRSD